jgi:RHS repeat-associated protein
LIATTAGTKVWTASYDPLGGVHVTTGAPIDLRFPGQWFQAEAGLHQNWMRDYDPATGRYLQADPLGLVDGASVYGYARGNPGRWTDPRGETAVAGGAIGAGVAGPPGAVVGAVIGGVVGYLGYKLYQWCMEECEAPKGIVWKVGGKKSQVKLERQMAARGWTHDMISEAVYCGECVDAPNKPFPSNGAKRCIHPKTGQSVVIDSTTNGVLQVGGPGFGFD